jgi:2-oxoisovalerate dehydrogenase E1 component
MREWILDNRIATEKELADLEKSAEEEAREAKKKAWDMFQTPIKVERDALVRIINERRCRCAEMLRRMQLRILLLI